MTNTSIVLASSSPRRKELLTLADISFRVFVKEANEECEGAPDERVTRIAERKALAVKPYLAHDIILAADTLVYCKGEVLGKPKDEGDAFRMLRLLSADIHRVYTGVCVMDLKSGQTHIRFDVTDVRFVPLNDREIQGYIATTEPMDKAGAYALQGRGGMFVKSIRGSHSNVIGLPMALVREMLLSVQGFQFI